ncbi:Sec-independent protein translocase protein TatB [Devosia sp.]|jgi:sec-independent protein translocase protein TatB|uniref:Sec-independent protein translocase protein TatB n=1 Tax=Devosia sp. TaxID=1871048 RepID=UPI0037C1528E
MLGVGWTEMMVIGVVALIVIGPKDLPAMMQKIGRFAGVIRRMGSDFQRELNKTTGLDEVRNLRSSITAPLKATTDAIRKEFNTTTASGTVQPSGALKPADPKAESVVNEIHAAAGIKPEPLPLTPKAAMERAVREKLAENEAAAAAAAPAAAAIAPEKAKPAAKAHATAAPDSVKPTPKAKKAVAKVESPAPVEAIAPAKPAAKPRKTAAAVAKPAAATKPEPNAAPKAAVKKTGVEAAAAKPKSRAKVAAVSPAASAPEVTTAAAPKAAALKTPRRKPAAAKA